MDHATQPSPTEPNGSTRSWREPLDWASLRIFVTGISVASTYFGACFGALLLYAFVFPPVTGIQLQRSIGDAFDENAPTRKYQPVPLTAIDPDLARAVVSGEDSRFFVHWGIDWSAIRTAIKEYQSGEDLRGGSSITQQLVKNLFMTTHRSYLRKAFEVPLTYAAELILSKRRILELYLNVIEWGRGVYGAEAAVQHYYGTSARTLSRSQAAALAACIPNPHVRRPQTVAWYRDIILQRMDILGRLPINGDVRRSPRASEPPRRMVEPTPSPVERTRPPSQARPDSHDPRSVKPPASDTVARPRPAAPESIAVEPAGPDTLVPDSIEIP